MQDFNVKRPSRARRLALHICTLAALLAASVAGASTLTPTISGTPPTSVISGHYYAFVPKAAGPAGHPLTFSISGKPVWAGFSKASGQLVGMPNSARAGEYSNIVIAVSDGVSSARLPAFTITVKAASKLAPTIYGNPSPLAIVGSRYTFTPKTGAPAGYGLTFSISGKPAWASFSTQSGQLSGTPKTANIGKYGNIMITATDGAGSTSLFPFAISVAAASSAAPRISGAPATSIVAGHNYVFTPQSSGPTGYPLTFSITGKPAFATFSRASGQLVFAPTAANVGKYSNIIISVSDGVKSASLAPFAISVTSGSTQGPTISGTPSTTATVGTAYAFTPKATAPTGKAISFSIKNKPAWASFSIASGKISGSPTTSNVGTYSSIVISVSDGSASASLAPFSIVVSQPSSGGGTGSASLHWTAPTKNTNGSGLTNLAGYHVYYGKSASTMTTSITIANPGTTSYTVSNLAAGTWYFSVNAYTTSGVASARSNTDTKVIP